MIFYVIGNGFDLHYGLQTSYRDFKYYLRNHGFRELVNKIDCLFSDFCYSPEEIDSWGEFEDMLEVFNRLDADDIYDEAMSNAENDDDRAGYWDSPAWNVSYYNEYIQVLKEQFELWISSFNTHITPDRFFTPKKGDFILTFNYTTTIEDNFPPATFDIAHIHGCVGDDLILGHNNYPSPSIFNIIEDEHSDYRDVTTKKAVNDVLEHAAVQYFKDSEEILFRFKDIFSTIQYFDKVVIMGLSCSPQDSIYVNEILKYSRVIDFYYHDLRSRRNFEQHAARSHAHINYFFW